MSSVDFAKLVNFIDRNMLKITVGGHGSPYDGEEQFYAIGNEFICKNKWSWNKDEYEFTFKGVTVTGDLAQGIYEQTEMLYKEAHADAIRRAHEDARRIQAFHQPIG